MKQAKRKQAINAALKAAAHIDPLPKLLLRAIPEQTPP